MVRYIVFVDLVIGPSIVCSVWFYVCFSLIVSVTVQLYSDTDLGFCAQVKTLYLQLGPVVGVPASTECVGCECQITVTVQLWSDPGSDTDLGVSVSKSDTCMFTTSPVVRCVCVLMSDK